MSLRERPNHSRFHASLRRAVKSLCVVIVGLSLVMTPGKAIQNTRPISYDDLPAELSGWLNQQGVNRENFAARISAIRRQTEERERIGEFDHLIFYLLQSSRFTELARIEPALSAYELVHSLGEIDRAKFLAEGSVFVPSSDKIPKTAKARINQFIAALKANRKRDDERLNYFDNLLRKTTSPILPILNVETLLSAEYLRAMRFLYRKEFASRSIKPEDLAAYVASLYQTRGHSTDTQIEANFVIHQALQVVKFSSPQTKLNQVLIVGPGLDFAPRTDLIDLFGPQSYQPFAVADSLLSLKLAEETKLQIHCVDINDRVIAHLQNLRQRSEIRLSILSGVKESAAHPIVDEYRNYFLNFGKSVGIESKLAVPDSFSAHLSKSLRIRREVVQAISAHRLNIVTERFADSLRFDLVIVTNVFPYFSPSELLFALTNISAMTATDGYLIHNELQTVPSNFVNALGLPLRQARTVMITSDKAAPLFDGVAIHQKTPRL
ncbi:MAG: hypothetical protein JNK38_12455 [Acidobacteria bacterium]|nr:hypothetical protein [Acidobacteriota bacterium]